MSLNPQNPEIERKWKKERGGKERETQEGGRQRGRSKSVCVCEREERVKREKGDREERMSDFLC